MGDGDKYVEDPMPARVMRGKKYNQLGFYLITL